GLGALGRDDLVLAKYTCIALQCLGPSRKRVKGMADDAHPRYARDHPVISQLQNIVQDQLESPDWFPLAEQAINAIYSLSEQPDVVCTEIIHRKTGEVLQTPNRKAEAEPAKEAARADPVAMDADSDADDDVVIPNLDPTDEVDTDPAATPTASATASAAPLTGSAYPLCQLVFLVGHVAIKQIILLEIIEAELKRRKGSDGAKKTPSKGDKGDEDELEQVTGTTEDEVADTINHIRERELLYGPTSLLARYGPLVAHLCSNAKAYPAPALLAQATLALSKLMCVSSAFCETHLPLLMSVLTQSQTPAIRSNIIIALGDITVCFNNLIGENVEYLYGPLHDSDRAVKKNTLMVLTHLVLNGMIKAKGQLGEMAKCLEDPDQRISDLAKLFFTELATKDNYLYNNLPDMISTLSTGLNAVTEAAFARIMKFLFEFIKDKDKQVENIAEKLCQRFRSNDDPRQWRDIAHCLSLMPYRSERSFKRLVDNFPYYYDKLGDSVVYKCLCDVVTRARAPGIQKAEFKALVDEFEAKVKDARIKCTGELETKEGNEGEHEGGAETVVADMATDHDGTAAGGPHHRDASPPRPSRKRAPNTPGSVLKANPTLAKPRGRGRATGRTVKFSAKKQRNAALWDTSSDEEEADEVEEDHHDDDDNRDDDDDPNDDISDMDDDEGATKDAPEDPFMDEDPAPRSKRGTSRSRRSAASVVSPSAAVVHVDIPPPPEFTTGTRRSSRRSTRLSKDAVPVSTRNSRRRMVESDDDNDMDEDE
ncbi:condensin complex non-SMC subunit Cnd1, partial [Tieghemiomyces parasiticus]